MKRLMFLFVSMSLLIQNSMAQFDLELFKTPAQQMVENAVKPSLIIVRSSFQVKSNETGVYYGLNGKKEFGEQVSYGIMTKDGVILCDQAVRPWNYDEKYPRYKKEYSPVLSVIRYSNIGDTEEYDTLSVAMKNMTALNDSSFYYCRSNTFKGEGLVVDSSIGNKAGWLLWITIPKDAATSITSDPTIVVQQKDIEITKKNDVFDIVSPKTDNSIMGGLFVVPSYERIGAVEFRLAGILKTENGEWELCCPFYNIEKANNAKANGNVSETEVGETPSTEELTPINGKPTTGKKKRTKSKD